MNQASARLMFLGRGLEAILLAEGDSARCMCLTSGGTCLIGAAATVDAYAGVCYALYRVGSDELGWRQLARSEKP